MTETYRLEESLERIAVAMNKIYEHALETTAAFLENWASTLQALEQMAEYEKIHPLPASPFIEDEVPLPTTENLIQDLIDNGFHITIGKNLGKVYIRPVPVQGRTSRAVESPTLAQATQKLYKQVSKGEQ